VVDSFHPFSDIWVQQIASQGACATYAAKTVGGLSGLNPRELVFKWSSQSGMCDAVQVDHEWLITIAQPGLRVSGVKLTKGWYVRRVDECKPSTLQPYWVTVPDENYN